MRKLLEYCVLLIGKARTALLCFTNLQLRSGPQMPGGFSLEHERAHYAADVIHSRFFGRSMDCMTGFPRCEQGPSGTNISILKNTHSK